MRTTLSRSVTAFLLVLLAPSAVSLPVALTAQQARVISLFVWEKVSPCVDSRQEWFTVAPNYPGEVGSAARWQKVDFPASSFSGAAAEADRRKLGGGFANRCCRDWAVLRDTSTNRLWAQRMLPGAQIPFGYVIQESQLCCEDAFNQANIPMSTDPYTAPDCRMLKLSDGRVINATEGPKGPQQSGGYYVWERISLCMDNRQEWFTVATNNPGEAGSANRWQRRSDELSFQQAMLFADQLKMGLGFRELNRCCREWGVYRNMETQQISVIKTSAGSPLPPNVTPIQTGLCCEEAFNRAGFPPGNDCRNLRLSDRSIVTIRPDRTFTRLTTTTTPGPGTTIFDDLLDPKNPRIPPPGRGGGTTEKPPTPQAGALVLVNTYVPPRVYDPYRPYDRDQGGRETTYTATTITLHQRRTNYAGEQPPPDYGTINSQWSFSGVPTVLVPGQRFRITVAGTITKSHPTHSTWRQTASVSVRGLKELGKQVPTMGDLQTGFLGSVQGWWEFEVPIGQTAAEIAIGGDNQAAIVYTYKRQP